MQIRELFELNNRLQHIKPRWSCQIILLLTTFISGPLFSQTIDRILIKGNLQTKADIIQQEMSLRPGSQISQSSLENSRQLIMDLGLFEKVEINHEQQNGETILIVQVKEKKHDWYILPRIDRNGDGDIGVGLNWRSNNLNGLNQTSRLSLLHKKFKDATEDEESRLSYTFTYPRIVNTMLSTYASVDLSHVQLEEEREGLTGFYNRRKYSIAAGLGRWFANSGVSKGYQADLGLQYTLYEHEHLSGEPNFYDDAAILSLVSNLRYSKVKDLLYSRDGRSIGLRLEYAQDGTGSDRTFFYQEFYYRQFIQLSHREHTNFNFQIQLANGDNSLFGEPIYELSGPHTLRGYPRETLEGNAFFLVNTEYLTPLFGKNNYRGGFLFDFGNAYEDLSDLKKVDFEYGIGLSLRWNPKQWVNTELRIDFAQGLGDLGESRFYVTANSTF